MTLYILFAVLAFAIIVGAWWHLFFGMPNSPLPQTSVSIQGSSTNAGATTTVSSSAPSGAASSSSVVDGENPPLPEESFSLDGATFTVEVASTMIEQARGLSFRPSLGADNGMLFLFGTGSVQTFWMKDMNFPLDMIWISGNTVAGFSQNVPAPAPGAQLWQLPIYSSPANTDKVLEVNAGTVAEYNIKVGDTVTIGPGISS